MPEYESIVIQRLEKLIDRDGPIPAFHPDLGPCWIWTGFCHASQGYGQANAYGRHFPAHWLYYLLTVSPVPDDLVLDHLCRVRNCVNPSHLEITTHKNNILRGTSPSARQAQQTHCKNGHPLEGSNLLIRSGKRGCRECTNLLKRSDKEKQRQREHYWANRESESIRQKAQNARRTALRRQKQES